MFTIVIQIIILAVTIAASFFIILMAGFFVWYLIVDVDIFENIDIFNIIEKIKNRKIYTLTILEGVEVVSKRLDASTYPNLIEIKFPSSVTIIRENTFENCHKLETLKLPSNLREICAFAFYNCKRLKHIEFPNSLSKIENFAFANCRSLVSVYIPVNVTELGCGTFQDCKNLKEVYISRNTKAESNTFIGCSNDLEIRYID